MGIEASFPTFIGNAGLIAGNSDRENDLFVDAVILLVVQSDHLINSIYLQFLLGTLD